MSCNQNKLTRLRYKNWQAEPSLTVLWSKYSFDFEKKTYEQNRARQFCNQNGHTLLTKFKNCGNLRWFTIKMNSHEFDTKVYQKNRARPLCGRNRLHDYKTMVYHLHRSCTICNQNKLMWHLTECSCAEASLSDLWSKWTQASSKKRFTSRTEPILTFRHQNALVRLLNILSQDMCAKKGKALTTSLQRWLLAPPLNHPQWLLTLLQPRGISTQDDLNWYHTLHYK